MHRDSEEYRSTVRMIEFFRKELEEARRERGESGVHVMIGREGPVQFVLHNPHKEGAAAEMEMDDAEADGTFLRAVQAGLIGARWDSSGPYASTAGAFVTHITPEGLAMLERWEEPSQPQAPIFNIFGDTYGSNIGTQQYAQVFQPTFTFGDLEQEIDRRGGEDAAALKAMVQEIKETLESQDSLSRSWLVRWSELVNKHGWITGAIAQLLLVYALTGKIG